MNEHRAMPELKEIVGALLFAARQPLGVKRMRRVLRETAEVQGGVYAQYAEATERDLAGAVESFVRDLEAAGLGLRVAEVAHGFRIENRPECGPWIRQMLDRNRTPKLTKPALETLAIIAYRQPCTRAEVESVRGVSADQMIRNLVELQLVKATGRSELPGRPWLFGTTQKFLEHFGLKTLGDLPNMEELRRAEREARERKPQEPSGGAEDGGADEASRPAESEPAGEQHDTGPVARED
ncbi:SMC-Scp complex subunit ScpB [Kiritimatiella glycovorans]|uniref:Segregation and condensation protein B n=1 Tax=Kiritimatiella glycovorans TaxID=1307763 RepID=A0A0G3ED74_9BACT|nr:SMC-Scp complex subunit ScpB [Kiritimatiella glycovorans]AKJ64273.1 hypothetical protein L21SP4_01014 [Kiritimatiella glycovorans]